MLVLEYRGVGAQPAAAQPPRRLVDHLGALAEREAHERAAGLRVVVEDARRDRDDAGALDQLAAERGRRPSPACESTLAK